MKKTPIKLILWYLGIGILLTGMISCETSSNQEIKKENISTSLLQPLLDSIHKDILKKEEQTFSLRKNILQGARTIYKKYEKQIKDIEQKKREVADSSESMD